MHTTKLRKVGGSIMLAIPPPLLDILDLRAGATVDVAIDGSRLVIVPARCPRYSLDELLAQCDPAAELSAEDSSWDAAAPEGRELI